MGAGKRTERRSRARGSWGKKVEFVDEPRRTVRGQAGERFGMENVGSCSSRDRDRWGEGSDHG
jgi:hypothetical protein